MRTKFRAYENEGFSATTSYANALIVDGRDIGDNILHIKNMSGSTAVQYKIYATPKATNSTLADNHDSWYNILNSSSDTYDHNKETEITVGSMARESLSNKYSWVRIQVKCTTGTATVKLWYRGNQFS